MGLMLAVQLDNFENIEKVIQICLEKGLIIDWFLFCDSALRISPPLIIEEKEIRESCEIILQAIAEVYD